MDGSRDSVKIGKLQENNFYACRIKAGFSSVKTISSPDAFNFATQTTIVRSNKIKICLQSALNMTLYFFIKINLFVERFQEPDDIVKASELKNRNSKTSTASGRQVMWTTLWVRD